MTRPGSRRLAVFCAVFVLALMILLPMRLVLSWTRLGDLGVSARHVSGSLWSGQLDDAQIDRIALGDVQAAVSPVRLLTGNVRIAIKGGAAPPLQGRVDLSPHGFGVNDFDTNLKGSSALAGLPIASLDLSDVTIRFERDQCALAQGRVRAALDGTIGDAPLPHAVAGTPRCSGKMLVLPLVSTSGNESLTITIRRDGGYSADMAIGTGDPALASKLQRAGFRPSAKGYMLSFTGQLRQG